MGLRPQRIENTATDASELLHRDHHSLIIYGLTPLGYGGLRSLVVHKCSIDFGDLQIYLGNTGVAIRFGRGSLQRGGLDRVPVERRCESKLQEFPWRPTPHAGGTAGAVSPRDGRRFFAQLVIPHPDDLPDVDFFPDGDLERSPSPLHHRGIAHLGSLDDFCAVRPPLGEAH